MALTSTTASYIASAKKVKGAFPTALTVDQFSEILPQQAINGYKLEIPIIAQSDFPDASSLAAHATLTGDVATPSPPISFYLARIGGDLEIDTLIGDNYHNINDIRELQIRFKKLAIIQKIGSHYIIGNSVGGTSDEFDGLEILTDASRTIAVSGSGLASDLERLIEMIDAEAVPDYFIAHSQAITQYVKFCFDKGTRPDTVVIEGFDRPTVAHRGIPILRDDHILIQNDVTHIFAVVLGWERGLCGIYPASQKDIFNPIVRIANEGVDVERIRVMGTCGIALFRQGALAKLTGVAV